MGLSWCLRRKQIDEPSLNEIEDKTKNLPNFKMAKCDEDLILSKETKHENSDLKKMGSVNSDLKTSESADHIDMTKKRKSASDIWKFQKKKTKSVKETHEVHRTSTDQGIKTINNYQIVKTLGQGAFGKVKLVIKKMLDFEKKFAVKVFKKANFRKKRTFGKSGAAFKDEMETIKKEIAVMKKLDHPNVIRLHEILDDEEKDKLYMVIDYAPKGQLIEWDDDLEKFYFCNKEEKNEDFLPEETLRQIFRDCLTGLHYLHINHIIHRDIKPQNLLFDEENRVKIADFGQSTLFGESDALESTEGTYWFMAPELLDSENKITISGKQADIWSLGVTFFAFTFLKVPFYGANVFELLENIKGKELEFPEDRGITEGLKSLLEKMITKNPEKRAHLIEIIKEPWLNEGCDPLEIEISKLEEVIVADEDLKEVFIPLERAFFLKKIAKKLKNAASKKNVLDNSIHENEKEGHEDIE